MLQNCYETLYTGCISIHGGKVPVDKKLSTESYPPVKSGTKSAISENAHSRATRQARIRACAYTHKDELELERKLRKLANNDGLTLRAGRAVSYKTGWQVADYGIERKTVRAAAKAVVKLGGNAGVWYSEGIYYIDHSFRVSTKREALKIGREHNQISVLKWSDMSLVYC